MRNEHIERLLALYATGSLTGDEKRELFAAALHDPELFDSLAEEDSIRELVEMPGAKARLLESLEEDRPAVPATPRRPLWFAWAAGMAVVLVSAGISYVAFEKSSNKAVEVSESRAPERPAPKPFTPPPPVPAVRKPAPRVDAPPVIESGPAQMPAMSAPLPSAPPPPLAREPERRRQELPKPALAERDEAKLARNQLADSAPAAGAAPVVKSHMATGASVWRRASDGIWIRVTPQDLVDRAAALSVRFTPLENASYAVTAGPGFSQVVPGRAGEEFDVVIPPRIVGSVEGNVLQISIAPRLTGGFRGVGGALDRRSAPVAETLTVRLKEK
ncbi:MAG: hypothetical protein FJW30_17580 [Acidobacteria bacterium]|nr:hypothetical protein [Acidobacteriota bacterium]